MSLLDFKSFFQSICVQQILAHPHTLRTIAFRSAHSHTARVCFLKIWDTNLLDEYLNTKIKFVIGLEF